MRVEEFEKLSREQLCTKVNERFGRTETAGMNDKPGLLLEAQFYMRELEHRADSWTSVRDFRMEIAVLFLEIVVIVLIGWEIHMGYQQENLQARDFGQQQQVLKNMQSDSAATAAILASLQGTTELMNGTLQKQLALFYDVSVNVLYDAGAKQVQFLNAGRTSVTIWGVKTADQPPAMEKEGRVIAPNGGYRVDASKANSLIEVKVPKGTTGLVPFELYLKNERGEEFIQHCYFAVSWDKDTLQLGVQTTSVLPERWSPRQK